MGLGGLGRGGVRREERTTKGARKKEQEKRGRVTEFRTRRSISQVERKM